MFRAGSIAWVGCRLQPSGLIFTHRQVSRPGPRFQPGLEFDFFRFSRFLHNTIPRRTNEDEYETYDVKRQKLLGHTLLANFANALAQGRVAEAWSRYREITSYRVVFTSLTCDQIVQLFRLVNANPTASTHTAIGDALIRSFEQLYPGEPPLVYFNEKICFYTRLTRLISARDVLNHMWYQGIRPDSATYGWLLSVPHNRNWRWVLYLYKRMLHQYDQEKEYLPELLAQGLQPLRLDLSVYHVMYGSAIINNMKQLADYFWKEIIRFHSSTLEPLTWHYRVMHVYQTTGQLQAAVDLTKFLLDHGIPLLNNTLIYLLRQGLAQDSPDPTTLDLVWFAQYQLRVRQYTWDTTSLSRLLCYYVQIRQYTLADELLRQTEAQYLPLELIWTYQSASENNTPLSTPTLATVVETVQELYITYLGQMVKQGLVPQADQLIKHIETVQQHHSLKLNERWFALVLRYYALAKLPDEVREFWQNMEPVHQISLTQDLANVLVQTSYYLGLFDLMAEAYQWLLVHSVPARKSTYLMVKYLTRQPRGIAAALHTVDAALAVTGVVSSPTLGLLEQLTSDLTDYHSDTPHYHQPLD
ncbi:hypothetical protein IWQ61_001558 [Dispira simplex]|nr:hypothetical protein IWQ61_001558 [Dispira simplex]